MFQNAVDICNRSAQHCGVSRIADFNEDSVQAAEFSFVYDKLRRAELRRNTWRFSTRKAALRPLSTGFMLLNPALWASTTTYGIGALITDTSNVIWQSRSQDNLNNNPGGSAAWELYCGPMTAMPYDTTGTTGYYAGELIYETPGDGSYVVYMSLASGNSQDPRVPSRWDPTIQYVRDQVARYYAAWAVGTTYAAGAVVRYSATAGASPVYYISLTAGNVGNVPGGSVTYWQTMPTTLAPTYYDSNTTYVIGQFVTYLGSNYVCILASTGNLPTNSTYWAQQTGGTNYVSLIDFNLNQNPATAAFAAWVSTTTYAMGDQVGGSDGTIYTSAINGNVGNDPVTDGGVNWTNTGVLNPWTTVNPFGLANIAWITLGVALTDLSFVYPLGSGPAFQTATRNAYRLPANYLRTAPQDPKAGSTSFLGAPSGLAYNDWEFESDYFVSRDSFPIVFRFVADVTDVTSMDDLYCELLGASIALATVDRITQSAAKKLSIAAVYKDTRTAAVVANGIETGSTEPPEDDYITCRI